MKGRRVRKSTMYRYKPEIIETTQLDRKRRVRQHQDE